MSAIFFALPGNEAMTRRLARLAKGRVGKLACHTFPDGEVLVRLDTRVKAHGVVFVCTLDRPDDKFLPLLFAADAARTQGARDVTLVAPYLGYMRQDKAFNAGEAISSRTFAHVLSGAFDRLVTVDPHLHRYKALSDIYAIPAIDVHAAPLFSRWIRRNIANPFLIGPDAESRQWVSEIAAGADAPFAVLRKRRTGDRRVRETAIAMPPRVTPVIVDDCISTGMTVLEAMRLVRRVTKARPVVMAVHGVFTPQTLRALRSKARAVVTTNTIANAVAGLDAAPLIAQALKRRTPRR